MTTEKTKKKHELQKKIEDVFSRHRFGSNYGTCTGYVKTKRVSFRTGKKTGEPRHYYVTGSEQQGHDDCGSGAD